LGFTSEIQIFSARNPMHQGMNYGARNALKLTYEHLEDKKIVGDYAPWTSNGEVWQRGREGEESRGGRRERKGFGPPKINSWIRQ
jgi:hypothetical protein